MLKKIKNILYLGSFFIFIILTTKFYFSDQNIRETNKSRSFYSVELNNNTQNLPLLKNDTNNIIEYLNDVEVYKKKKKKFSFFDLINGKFIASNNAYALSLSFPLVSIVISIPLIRSTLSKFISGKIICSFIPKLKFPDLSNPFTLRP